jgi:4-amino-4-deoxy-L-arabinose transferase-like glycosyltransferase
MSDGANGLSTSAIFFTDPAPSYSGRFYWLTTFLSVVGVGLVFVPLDFLTRVGSQISPIGSIQDKTVLLFEILKIALPLLGITTLVWLNIPARLRATIRTCLDDKVFNANWALPGILILSVVLRAGWVLFYPTTPYAEARWYFELATRLANGEGYGYTLTHLRPTAAWPVGYPAFLAVLFTMFGPSTVVARLANIGLEVLLVYLTYRLALRLFDRPIALLSALLIAVMPGFIVYTSLVSTDVLFAVLALLTLLLTLGKPVPAPSLNTKRVLTTGLLAGLIDGIMILTRATGLTLFPVWALIHWVTIRHTSNAAKRWWLWIFAFGLGTALFVVPWTIRNYVHFHKIIPVSTGGGVNFWMGNNPLAVGGYVYPRDPKLNPFLSMADQEIAADELGYRLGFQFIREYPERIPRLIFGKIFYIFNSNDAGLAWNGKSAISPTDQPIEPPVYAATDAVYTVMASLAILGLAALAIQGNAPPLSWLGVFLTIYWTLTHLPFSGIDRYTVPLFPFLTTYAGVGVIALLRFSNRPTPLK